MVDRSGACVARLRPPDIHAHPSQEPSLSDSPTVDAPETDEARDGAARRRALPSWAPDAAIALALAMVAAFYRRGMLPTDGLWFDDSWVAAGAVLGTPGTLLTVGSGHPGFTALLMAVDRAGGGDLQNLALPALVAGIVAPSLLYLLSRSMRHSRGVSLLIGAVLVVAPIPLLYAGRVKGYTTDVVVVLLLALVVPRLAARTWHWPLAVAWVGGAWLFGTFSGYTLVATAGAGLILFLHPSGDRWVRAAAVGVQGVGQALYLREAQSRTNLENIDQFLHDFYDAHLKFSANPIDFGREVLQHLRRIAEVYPGTSGGWLALFGVLFVVGLVLASTSGRTPGAKVSARFLLLIVAIAFVGGVTDQFPFGPTNGDPVSPGGRHTLWMVPAVAIGLAAVADRLIRLLPAGAVRRAGDIALGAVAVAVLIGSHGPAPTYPFGGSEGVTHWVERQLGPDDRVVITLSSTYSYPISSELDVSLADTPQLEVGFSPVVDDPRVLTTGSWVVPPPTSEEIEAHVQGAERVFVVASGLVGYRDVLRVRAVLTDAGFEQVDSHTVGWTVAEEWQPA